MEETHQKQQRQVRRLAQTLLLQPDDAACAACLDALDDYVAGQLAGEDYAAQRPAVAQHMDSCVACAEAYTLLYELGLAEYAAPLPAEIRAADLSFLQPGATGPLTPDALRAARRATRLRDALASAVERAGTRLRLTLSQVLLDLLPPPSGPALAFRSDVAGPALFALELASPAADIDRLQLSAYVAAPERCVVRVQLTPRGREWPDLAGVLVALELDQQRRQASTDAWGEVVFDDVPLAGLAGLRVEVEAEETQ